MLPQELQDKFYNDFPGLFADRFDGFWLPIGWFDLVYDLSKEIYTIRKSLITILDSDYQVVQIKEKFSGLRYYMSNSTPEMNDIISKAEIKSYDMCGACGGDKGLRKPTETIWKANFCEKCTIIKNIIE